MAVAAPKNNNASIIIVVLAVTVVVIMICGGILVALLLPAISAAREAARRSACMNNLRQINLAMLQYETQYGKFPPAYVADKNGRPMHSWRVLLLPFLDANDVYSQYDFNEPWDGPKNRQLAARMPRAYRCPSSAGEPGVVTDYLVITGPGTVFVDDKSMSMAGIRDGISNTILVAEVSGADIHWMEPRDLELQKIDFSPNPLPGRSLHSSHFGGSNVGFADGSARFLPGTMSPADVRALITADGGEAVVPIF
jgi:prepilin-type processing-associated H-X9-DG protein